MLIQLSTGNWVNPALVTTITLGFGKAKSPAVLINGVAVVTVANWSEARTERDQIAKEINAALQGK